MSIKFFIIEDDINILSTLRAKFSVAGFEVAGDTAGGGVKDMTLQILSEKPDYVIMDMVLPRFDGPQLMNELRADDFIANIPIIAFADTSEKDIKTRYEALGSDNFYYIRNNFNIDEFVLKVKKIIRNRQKILSHRN